MQKGRLGIKSLFFIICLLSACVPQKKLKYLQVTDEANQTAEFTMQERNQVLVQPYDELYIKVSSMDENSSSLFKQETMARYSDASTLYLISYKVSKDGTIDFPFVGKISVVGETVEQVKLKIEKLLEDYLDQPTVVVKIINQTITILGEVAKPGQFTFSKDQINIFQALGMAGDISYYGDRENVVIVREYSGKTKIHHVDLTDRNLIQSEFYYLRPNDVIYIEPMKKKVWGIKSVPFSLILSSITTFLLIYNAMK